MKKKYIGIDYHKKCSQVMATDEKGKIKNRVKLATKKEEI